VLVDECTFGTRAKSWSSGRVVNKGSPEMEVATRELTICGKQ
jgi:hypothetical protein